MTNTELPPTRVHRRWPAFDYPGYRWFWFGGLVSRTGSWVHNAAVPFALFQMTHEPIWVGIAGFAFLFPQIGHSGWHNRGPWHYSPQY